MVTRTHRELLNNVVQAFTRFTGKVEHCEISGSNSVVVITEDNSRWFVGLSPIRTFNARYKPVPTTELYIVKVDETGMPLKPPYIDRSRSYRLDLTDGKNKGTVGWPETTISTEEAHDIINGVVDAQIPLNADLRIKGHRSSLI